MRRFGANYDGDMVELMDNEHMKDGDYVRFDDAERYRAGLERLQQELNISEQRVAELSDIIECLLDFSGEPLVRDRASWNDAVRRAEIATGRRKI